MATHQAVVSALSDNPELIGVLLAVIGALGHYAKTGKVPLGRLPWHYFRETLRDLRYAYFDYPRPRGVPAIITDDPVETVERRLREKHHVEGVPYSYYYNREVANLRRPSGRRRHPQTGEMVQMALHLRGFTLADGRTLWIAHDEPSRYEEQGLHLSETMLSWERGREMCAELFEAAGIAHDKIASERDADVTVVSPDREGDGAMVSILRRHIPSG